MRSSINRIYILSGFLLLTILNIYSQKKVVDQIVAVVGDNVILQSEIEQQQMQLIAQGYRSRGDMKCEICEELLVQKLLLNQAEIDSIFVSEGTVELQLDQRLNFFIRQIGSREKLEAYFNKSTLEIKEDFRDIIREQLITQQMQSNIISETNVTPSDVRKYYNKLSKDSLPYIDATIQVRQLVLHPPFNEEAIFEVKEKLLDLRRRILKGEKFSTLAVLYSEGPEATKGGERGYLSKSEMEKEYSKIAFGLKKGVVSKIVKTEAGFHLIELIDRQEDRINTRHIIMKPKVAPETTQKALKKLDSIANLIRLDTLTFEIAAKMYSHDEQTRINGGLMINPITGNTRFHMDDFEARDYYVLKDMNIGEISQPFQTEDENGNKVYKIFMIISRSKPHEANLIEDYNIIKEMAVAYYQEKAINKWISEKQESSFIRIDDSFKNCAFHRQGWVK